jgi:hypothetical protein
MQVYFKEFMKNKKNKKFLNQKEYYTNLIDIFRTISQDGIEYEAIIFHYCDKYSISLPGLLGLPPREVYGEKGQIQTTKSFKTDIQAIKLKVYEKYFKTE